MAAVPTEVKQLSLLAGNGLPCFIAAQTSTPVGGLLRIKSSAEMLQCVNQVRIICRFRFFSHYRNR